VTGAAGAVGSMAGQLAKLAGARVIGTTSSAKKCKWLIDELGYDVAINYNDHDWIEQLEKESPNRINIIFDNTGGVVMNESLKLIAMHGVVLLCGSTSQYTEDKMDGPSNYIWLGSMRARLQGFVIFDYIDRYPEARENMSKWINSGLLKIPEYCCEGDIDDFPETFRKLFEGENLGKMLLKLSNI
jgi:NADPH-dependent curcumin reductase CurA